MIATLITMPMPFPNVPLLFHDVTKNKSFYDVGCSDLQIQVRFVWSKRNILHTCASLVEKSPGFGSLTKAEATTPVPWRLVQARTCVERKRSIPIFNASFILFGEDEEYSDLQ
ncbi:hypothetical protein Bbelb_089170 [Branchiostoma belcheri]|nr:hypothetical protein Bbelb_089170 [Branchiostoma belcheri]